MVLKIGSGYRTVSNQALQVVTGILYMDFLVEKRFLLESKEDIDISLKSQVKRDYSMVSEMEQ